MRLVQLIVPTSIRTQVSNFLRSCAKIHFNRQFLKQGIVPKFKCRQLFNDMMQVEGPDDDLIEVETSSLDYTIKFCV